MTDFFKAAVNRAVRTLIQVVAASAITAIGSATTIGEVDWVHVASTAALAGVLSILTSLATGLPEVDKYKDPVKLEDNNDE